MKIKLPNFFTRFIVSYFKKVTNQLFSSSYYYFFLAIIEAYSIFMLTCYFWSFSTKKVWKYLQQQGNGFSIPHFFIHFVLYLIIIWSSAVPITLQQKIWGRKSHSLALPMNTKRYFRLPAPKKDHPVQFIHIFKGISNLLF